MLAYKQMVLLLEGGSPVMNIADTSMNVHKRGLSGELF